MSNKIVMVTGGAGFIGSHTCKFLKNSGYVPVVFDNLSTGHREAVKFGPFFEGDIRRKSDVDRALKEWRPSAVIHFAASAYVGESVEDPAKYYDNNVCGTLELLRACKDFDIKKFVFSSSCATYGSPQHLPINEACDQRPINPYGWSKLICEKMLKDFDSAYGLNHISLRYFNAAGADHEGELTERHNPETHLIPCALMAASGMATHLQIFGSDYDTPDGTCIRDFIHVEDLANGHVKALNKLDSGCPSTCLNLGSGHGTSIREIVAAIERLTGRSVPVKYRERRAGDPAILYADPSESRSILGFDACRSDIDTIVNDAKRSFGL